MQRDIRHGVVGGLVGGLVFAGIMVINGTLSNMEMLTLPLIGSFVGHPSAWVGLAVHLLNSALIGAGYVITLGRYDRGMIDGLHLGMIYGAFWWFLGPLTVMPLLLGDAVGSRWSLDNALEMFPSFIGHVVFGLILGFAYGLRRDASRYARPPAPSPARPPGATPPRPVPVWMSLGLMFVLFVLNVVIFGYAASSGGFPPGRASRPPVAAVVAEQPGGAPEQDHGAEGAAESAQ
jgi:uncharacterized membrane protein YagU involved in acid resistance